MRKLKALICKISSKIWFFILAIIVLIAIYFIYQWSSKETARAEPIVVFIDMFVIPLVYYCYRTSKSSKVISTLEATPQINIFNSIVIDYPDGYHYRFQINFGISSLYGSVHIRSMKLTHSGCFEEQVIDLHSLFPELSQDLLVLKHADYINTLDSLRKTGNAISSSNVVVNEGEWKYFTATDYITSERLPDGYENFNCNNWSLIINFNGGSEFKYDLSFAVHKCSEKIPIAYRYTHFDE